MFQWPAGVSSLQGGKQSGVGYNRPTRQLLIKYPVAECCIVLYGRVGLLHSIVVCGVQSDADDAAYD